MFAKITVLTSIFALASAEGGSLLNLGGYGAPSLATGGLLQGTSSLVGHGVAPVLSAPAINYRPAINVASVPVATRLNLAPHPQVAPIVRTVSSPIVRTNYATAVPVSAPIVRTNYQPALIHPNIGVAQAPLLQSSPYGAVSVGHPNNLLGVGQVPQLALANNVGLNYGHY